MTNQVTYVCWWTLIEGGIVRFAVLLIFSRRGRSFLIKNIYKKQLLSYYWEELGGGRLGDNGSYGQIPGGPVQYWGADIARLIRGR
jgi:hypothetical protein